MAATEAGREAAYTLDALYRTHVGEVYRYAFAMLGNRADAEDVTQTTFLSALRALARGESPRKPSNWLIRIAHNLVRQRFRQQQRRPLTIELEHTAAAYERPEVTGPTMDELVRGLQRIPHSQREALVLREFEGRSYQEIAEILGLSMGAVETLLFRARRSLAEELESLDNCDWAQIAMSKLTDGRLTRNERRRLEAHLCDCPSCMRLEAGQSRYRRALKALALLPLPFSLPLFKGSPGASGATGLSVTGAGSTAVGGGATLGAAGGTVGGLAAGGVAAKVAIVIASVAVAGSFSYEGVTLAHDHAGTKRPAKAGAGMTTNADPHSNQKRTSPRSATSSRGKASPNGGASFASMALSKNRSNRVGWATAAHRQQIAARVRSATHRASPAHPSGRPALDKAFASAGRNPRSTGADKTSGIPATELPRAAKRSRDTVKGIGHTADRSRGPIALATAAKPATPDKAQATGKGSGPTKP